MGRVGVAVSSVLLALVAGCATTGDVQVAGPAAQVKPPPTTTPLPKGTPQSEDPVAVLRADPKVNPKIKSAVVPCEDGHYPVDARYADLTGDGTAELIVTIGECPIVKGAVQVSRPTTGYAAYVYDIKEHPAVRLFGVEEGGVEIIPESDRLLAVVHTRYLASDDLCCPTDQTFVLYRWTGTKFVETRK